MAGVEIKKGLTPSGNIDDAGFFGGMTTYQAATGNALYTGQLVKLNSSGLVVPVTDDEDLTTTRVLGTIAGLFYIDSNGNPKHDKDVASSITSGSSNGVAYDGIVFTAASGVGVKVNISPNTLYMAKMVNADADNLINQDNIGDYVQVDNNATNARLTLTRADDGSTDVPLTRANAIVVNIVRTEGGVAFGSTPSTVTNDWGSDETVILVKLVNTLF
jgi:hypothetical protein